MKINCFALGMMGTNCYLINEGNDAVLIDPASYSNQITQYIKENNLTLKGILLTHAHFDHSLGCPDFAAEFGLPIHIGADDKEMLFDFTKDASNMVGLKYRIEDMPEIIKIYDNDILTFGEIKMQVIATPGHTKGGVSYYIKNENVLFSGDTLFFRSVGRTDLYGSDYSSLVESIKNKLYKLPDITKVYCGHSQPTEIGFEKVNNMAVWL